MSKVSVVGGVYREFCEWPHWEEVYGSAGRAAVAITDMVDEVDLHCCLDEETKRQFQGIAEAFDIRLQARPRQDDISFQYRNVLTRPKIFPPRQHIKAADAFSVEGDVVLVFGMLEANPIIRAKKCVYDPQNPISPKGFRDGGGVAERLAIVGNRAEICGLAEIDDDTAAAQFILTKEAAEAVVVKCGLQGAKVVTTAGVLTVPAYVSGGGWTLGSGDVFAACFAAAWGAMGVDPQIAANKASWAVSRYLESRTLPATLPSETELAEARPVGAPPSIYLAGPFFTMEQRWLVEEARQYLTEMGARVFSPFHEIGEGPAEVVAPADLKALNASDVVLALIDGCDPGTIFEIGYAVAKGKRSYAYATRVPEPDLKMLVGSGVKVIDDFATAIFQAVSLA